YGSNNKPNACWGETSNIIYVSMNRNKVIYRIFLGEGENDLSQLPGGWGVFNNSPYLDYNGTCRVLGRYDMIKDHGINQDMTYHNGKIYIAESHDKILTNVYQLMSNGYVKLVDSYIAEIRDEQGNVMSYEPEGVAIDSGKIYQGYRRVEDGELIRGLVVTPL